MLRTIAIAVAVVLIVWLLSSIVLLICMAALLAVMLRGVSDWVARHSGASEKAMLAVVSVAVTALVLGFAYYIGPRLIAQSEDLWSQVNQSFDHLRDLYSGTAWGQVVFRHFSPPEVVQQHIASNVGSLASTTIGGLTTAFILLVTALYFAIAPEVYVRGVIRLFPLRYRPRARLALQHVGAALRSWSLGQLIDMMAVAVLTGVGLVLLGVPLALALAVLSGLFTFVPYFGAIAAAVPAALIGFTVSWQTSLWVIAIFLLCHTIEGYIIAPIVQRNATDLPPALTILSMTILGGLFGPLGVILGAPIAAASLVLVRELYVGEVLEDPDFKI